MNIMLTAAFLRAKAVEYNEVYNWIQEDFEQVLTKAKVYEMEAQPYSTLCAATNPANGLAASFITSTVGGLGGSSTSLGQRSFGEKTLSLTRTASYAESRAPKKLLTVNYAVLPIGSNQTVFEIETKVVMYAAFNCPSLE
ncbi:MAG: prepilin-type cleavage/methylation domain-containing protein [Thermosynechococcaceae cyanobacterium]